MIYACTAPARSVARAPRRAMRRARGDDVARAALDRADFARLSPRARHAALLDEATRDAPRARGDGDALAREHRFVRDDEEDERRGDAWAVRLARRYHEKLYKAYAVFDLSLIHI